MDKAIQLFGSLVLTSLGFIAPIVGILLSIFREGILILTIQYENEKVKSENNIKEQLKKQGDAEKTDAKAIQKSLDELNNIIKIANRKLSFLNPRIQIPRLFIFLMLSLLGVACFFLTASFYKILVFLISLLCFSYAIFMLWKFLGIIVEAKKAIDDNKKETNTKIIELLSKIVEKLEDGTIAFLKDVYIAIKGKKIKDDKQEIELKAEEQETIKIAIINTEDRMAKNIEIGFIFTVDFIIEKKDYYSLYIGQENQIIRYHVDSVQGNTDSILGPLAIKPLKKGDYKVKTFVKAENIKSIYKSVILKVI